jgi:hypothetical protein
MTMHGSLFVTFCILSFWFLFALAGMIAAAIAGKFLIACFSAVVAYILGRIAAQVYRAM